MKFRKLALASAAMAAMGVNGLATAGVTGLPGEGLLVPLVLGTDGDVDADSIATYVTLSVPGTIGQDTMINFFTAPHSTAILTTTTQEPKDARIRWTLFDVNSTRVADGYCPISNNDVTVWTNDARLINIQRAQDRAMVGLGLVGIPSNVCGYTGDLRFGYLVFQTVEGALGRDADFAMAGDAGIAINTDGFLPSLDGVLGIPVFPMADGADASLNQAPALFNEIIASSYSTVLQPKDYAPIFAGNRMNDALPPLNTNEVIVQMPIQGPGTLGVWDGFPTPVVPTSMPNISLHAFWFDRVNPSRSVTVDMYDDMEQPCSFTLPMPREVAVFAPNGWITPVQFPPGSSNLPQGWENLSSLNTGVPSAGVAWPWARGNGFGSAGIPGTIVDLVTATQGGTSYAPQQMCEPAYWQPFDLSDNRYPGSIAGMLAYNFIEEGETDSNFVPGSVNSASVAFHAQRWTPPFFRMAMPVGAAESSVNGKGMPYWTPYGQWTTHMGTARGVMD